MDILSIAFILFFIVNFLFAQEIYKSTKYIFLGLACSLIFCCICVILPQNIFDFSQRLNIGVVNVNFFVILLVIKYFYKKVNSYFVKRKKLREEFAGKDFTYVMWDEQVSVIGDWWNKKLATKPSWIDYVCTYLLLILPTFMYWIFS